jgi:hypothetical protein
MNALAGSVMLKQCFELVIVSELHKPHDTVKTQGAAAPDAGARGYSSALVNYTESNSTTTTSFIRL